MHVKSLWFEYDQDTQIEFDQWLHWFDECQRSMLDDDEEYKEFLSSYKKWEIKINPQFAKTDCETDDHYDYWLMLSFFEWYEDTRKKLRREKRKQLLQVWFNIVDDFNWNYLLFIIWNVWNLY